MKKNIVSTFFRFIILFALLALSFFGLRYYFTNREEVTYEAPLSPVKVVKAEKGSILSTLTFSGYIESEQMVPIVPFVQGTILEYYIEAGDKVEKDEVVAKIDSEPYRLQYAQAEAQAKVYESTYERMNALYEANAVTRQDLEGITAQRDAASAQLELAKLQLSYADVKAPAGGTVVISKAGVGSIATNTDFLAIIADMDSLIVNLNISASYYDVIQDNLDKIEITVVDNSRGLESKASIVSVAPYIDPLSRNFSIKLSLDSPENFTIGSAVSVNITYDRADDVYTLPREIMRLDGSLYYIEDDTAHLYRYTPKLSNESYVEAPEGMENNLFVIEGQNNLFDGQRVRVLEG